MKSRRRLFYLAVWFFWSCVGTLAILRLSAALDISSHIVSVAIAFWTVLWWVLSLTLWIRNTRSQDYVAPATFTNALRNIGVESLLLTIQPTGDKVLVRMLVYGYVATNDVAMKLYDLLMDRQISVGSIDENLPASLGATIDYASCTGVIMLVIDRREVERWR